MLRTLSSGLLMVIVTILFTTGSITVDLAIILSMASMFPSVTFLGFVAMYYAAFAGSIVIPNMVQKARLKTSS